MCYKTVANGCLSIFLFIHIYISIIYLNTLLAPQLLNLYYYGSDWYISSQHNLTFIIKHTSLSIYCNHITEKTYIFQWFIFVLVINNIRSGKMFSFPLLTCFPYLLNCLTLSFSKVLSASFHIFIFWYSPLIFDFSFFSNSSLARALTLQFPN